MRDCVGGEQSAKIIMQARGALRLSAPGSGSDCSFTSVRFLTLDARGKQRVNACGIFVRLLYYDQKVR